MEYNDYELLSYIGEGSEEACNLLFQKYKPFIISYAKKLFSSKEPLGLDLNDLIQEGMLGLHVAIHSFQENKEVKFYTYAKTCIENRMNTIVTKARRQKHKFLNESVSLEGGEEEFGLEKVVGDQTSNPEYMMIDQEEHLLLLQKLKDKLSDFEEQVFELKQSGFRYKEIADILDKDVKAIDNTIGRIKNKLKGIMEKEQV